jgi:type I restriction enzyme S subunit
MMRQHGVHPLYWAGEKYIPPADWLIRPIKDYATVVKGKMPSELFKEPLEGSLPYLLIDGLGDGESLYTNEIHLPITEETDTVVVADGSRSGLAIRGMRGVLGSTLLAYRAKDGIDSDYLFYVLESLYPFNNTATIGGAIPHLDKRLLAMVTLATPEYDEQHRIATALKLADDAIQKAGTELKANRELTRSLMSDLFVRGIGLSRRSTQQTKLGIIPKDWNVAELRTFWTSSANGLYVPEDLYGTGIPIIRIDTFNDGFFYTQEFKRIRVGAEDVQSYVIKEGDLLVNRVNSIPFLGKVAYVESVPEFTVFESNMMRLRFPTKEMAKYLSLYLSVPATKKRIWAMGRPAVAQLSINQRDVGKFLVAMPGEGERSEIVDAVSTVKLAEDRAADTLRVMLEVKRSLLQNLLTGKIRIPEGAIHA